MIVRVELSRMSDCTVVISGEDVYCRVLWWLVLCVADDICLLLVVL